jgi:putative phosphoribosyl transferase
MQVFRDRRDAGAQLALRLARYAGSRDAIVLALPRGGVPVGYEIATRLHVPFDVLVVRKLGVPACPELAMGAVASGGIRVIDHQTIARLGITPEAFSRVLADEVAELARRDRSYRAGRPPAKVKGKQAILVDDGLATGATMAAGIDSVKTLAPARVIVAVPVAPPEAIALLAPRADEIICLLSPPDLHAVGLWYANFGQTTDAEVRELLAASHGKSRSPRASPEGVR